MDRLESAIELELPLESVREFKVTLESMKGTDLIVESAEELESALQLIEVLSTECELDWLEESVLTRPAAFLLLLDRKLQLVKTSFREI
jgi:hypothetical protein